MFQVAKIIGFRPKSIFKPNGILTFLISKEVCQGLNSRPPAYAFTSQPVLKTILFLIILRNGLSDWKEIIHAYPKLKRLIDVSNEKTND